MGNAVKDLVAKAVVRAHRAIYKASGGRVLGGVAGMPVLELTTTGRKSGTRRAVMLTSPIRHQGNFVVVASRGGDDRPPAWYLNLVADPSVEVATDGKPSATMTARVATPAEREQLWPEVVKVYKGYGGYQQKTDREIPLVVLEA